MASKFTGEIDIGKSFSRFLNFLFGTTARLLITSGFGLISFGLFDTVVYIAELMIGKSNLKHPSSFDWQSLLGIFCITLGLLIKLSEFSYTKRKKQEKEEIEFFENYNSYSPAKFWIRCKNLFGLIYPDFETAKKALSHPTNQGHAFACYKAAHLHVKISEPWLAYEGRFFKLRRFFLGLIAIIGIPFLIFFILLMTAFEVYQPGITASGQYAVYVYAVLAFLSLLAGFFIVSDYKKMGHAVTLVEKLKPNTV